MRPGQTGVEVTSQISSRDFVPVELTNSAYAALLGGDFAEVRATVSATTN